MGRSSFIHALMCALIVLGGFPFVGFGASLAQEMPTTEPIVNVEIVLDSSGSMAAATSTGELRYTAAQSVLQQVITALPDQSTANVGLRVFGQGGDNTENGRAASCVSTELLVPISGVDKPALSQAVNAFSPVGWTPMALALDSAGQDFASTDQASTTNVVVLVTDGLETCGGDPVASAASLQSSDQNITTYVIGFGTTQDEQTTLNGVAQAGGGQLFGAENASELSTAIFDILEDLEIVVGAGYIGGNAFGLLGTAPIGTVDVVSYSGGQYGGLPIVIHNNLGQDISSVQVSMTIRGADGALIASGESQNSVSPRYLRAGGYAIGSIYLGSDFVFPAGAQVEFSITFGPATLISPYEKVDFDVIEAAIYEDRIVGSIENGHQVEGKNGVEVLAICFDGLGMPVSFERTYLDNQSVAPGTQLTFQINRIGYWNGLPCDAFLVTGASNSPGSMPVQSPPTAMPVDATETPVAKADASPVASTTEGNQSLPIGQAPYPLPVQDPRLGSTYSNIDGVVDAAARNFESNTDRGLWISVVVAKFDSPKNAINAMPIVDERIRANQVANPMPRFGEEVDLPVPEGFDASIANFYVFEGSYPAQYSSSITAVRGDELYIIEWSGYSPSYNVGVIDLLHSSVITPIDRGLGDQNEPTWGIWGLMPTSAEIPLGYSMTLNYVPRSFGPIPPTE